MSNELRRFYFNNKKEIKSLINRICDYVEKNEKEKEKVYIAHKRINGKEEDGNFYEEISIDELRNLDKILGQVDIEIIEYSISITNMSCSYFKKNKKM